MLKFNWTKQKNKQKQSKPPYTTSTMQQDASSKLNFNAKKTMQIAQKLYEGIELEDETVGLITYMRTDSIRLSICSSPEISLIFSVQCSNCLYSVWIISSL